MLKPPESGPRVELVIFAGCPHVAQTRERLRLALAGERLAVQWREWDLADGFTPNRYGAWPSPTVLVDGVSVAGELAGAGPACALAGSPSVEAIRHALRARHRLPDDESTGAD
ncbi:MAG: hypothetical protein AB7R55_11680 [Gemmatimonadales bacterium]